ncbi:SurA N-terminal domain-containing protein [Candidatus Williamhamiltonella defendens]|uniref:SurA N-terminal domain-containing protein n=1 Tax=Candidatus Williamhamiltonella defendens TaxID=138072 RepID=UPI00130DF0EE|nr:SurA N-terminal domain-containing protein [Candidatus Hamiltonella defensa]
MKYWRIYVLVWFLGSHFTVFPAPKEINKIVAIVNDSVILQSDINHRLKVIKMNANNMHQSLPEEVILRQQILERLIVESMQLQIADKIGFKILDDDLDKIITDIARKNRLTVDEIRNKLAAENIHYGTYRNEIRNQILIAEVLKNAVKPRINIFPQEVNALSKLILNEKNQHMELNLSQILIPITDNSSQKEIDKAEKKANKLVSQLKKDVKLGVAYSADSQPLKWGMIGWKKVQELPTLFSEKLKGIHKHKFDIIGPIRSEIGFYILRINDLHTIFENSEDIKNQAYKILFNRKFSEQAETWIQEQRASAYVKIFEHDNE